MSSAPAIADPRDSYKRQKSTRSNFELYGWVFMRGSGVVLLVLIFGHLFVNPWWATASTPSTSPFVGGKWASPFWQIWDLLYAGGWG